MIFLNIVGTGHYKSRFTGYGSNMHFSLSMGTRFILDHVGETAQLLLSLGNPHCET